MGYGASDMNYKSATVDEIFKHFMTISRQRFHQLRVKHSGDLQISSKFEAVGKLIKDQKYEDKHGRPLSVSSKLSELWYGINSRCGNRCGKSPAYADCSVGFDSYESFGNWAVGQFGFNVDGYELDKDILFKGNRVYGEATCAFVPSAVNALMVGSVSYTRRGLHPIGVTYNKANNCYLAQMKSGNPAKGYIGQYEDAESAFNAYKLAKEARVREVAELYRDKVDPRVYASLMNFTVEITD